VVLNVVLLFVYYSKYLKVDEADFGRIDLLKEGFHSSFGVFLVSGQWWWRRRSGR
jgi:hypothetical protein